MYISISISISLSLSLYIYIHTHVLYKRNILITIIYNMTHHNKSCYPVRN